MKVVLDTNLLVSALISPHGPPAIIVQMIGAEDLVPCYDGRIFAEYRDVLMRPEFPFATEQVNALLEQIKAVGEQVVSRPLKERLPDPDDEPFLEVAVAARADALVTGNLKHFPPERRQGVRVLAPRAFVEWLR